MSDISIPGVAGSSKYNTSEIIKKLMEAERIPLTRMEEKVDQLELQKKTWQDLNRQIVELRSSSKYLWSFENPFNDRIASSSDENVLTATATREAIQEDLEFTVLQTAKGDRYVSDSIDTKYSVPAGNYRFVIGEKEINISYRGGKIKDFAETINEKAEGYLRANVIRNTADTYVFSLEGAKTGVENKLFFADKATEFGIKAGMLKESISAQAHIDLKTTELKPWISARINSKNVFVSDDTLVLEPGADVRLPFPSEVELRENYILEYEINVKNTLGEYREPAAPPGPEKAGLDPLRFEGITIYGQDSLLELPDWKAPEKPPFVSDLNVMYMESRGSVISLPALEDTDGPVKNQIKIGSLAQSIDSLNLKNRNTDRTITISNIRIYDPSSVGGYEPRNMVSAASDSKLLVDGIEITRSTNTIDDLVPGVTLHLKKAGEKEVTLTIEPDRKTVKDSIIKMVYDYNSVMEEIQILTSKNENTLDEIFHLSDEEREKKKELLGLFQGEITFMQMKSQLQTIMMEQYETKAGDALSMLAQIGISTNSTGGSVDSSKLRGYLEINEEKLDQALESKMETIKQLFGNDTDNDLSTDTGVAYMLDNYLNTYVRTGGIVDSRVSTLDGNIQRTNSEMERFEARLERKEEELRRKYGMMEGTLNSLEGTQNSLDGFFNNKE
ncbi:MAG: flagellar filament capping protein FliD [Spirochaetales bacterium]|nr:flagellar filament capping protein FliD [Spirochaetales bacterium]